ncbi:bifunctional glutamate N-acetyltransferase/amino-acid acetyltransferase ArgJ [Fodinicurvata fenggangensis]|uniref:bifunctional glutamate N-acetyltransferase/amino-acid acetyltransferase ArgJ n=1 Tax=Fodinicurvata fenggangensis TaxID=1121830 RepID=UPI00047AF0E1|nr:bifunctional glutamate N-acetyltransferase/amino-acid acetyltransferase ArgJ [Fodinicurvata fenggangensis]
MPELSPLAPDSFPLLPPVEGVELATAATGLRYKKRDDALLMRFAPGTTVAGVLTRSQTAGAPVLWCREALAGGRVQAILVNSGNANAFTGRAGIASVERCVSSTANVLDCSNREVFVASTGVIGEPLPDNKLTDSLPELLDSLSQDRWEAAARAIMTTDTFPKGATRTTDIDGKTVTLNGIAKGSGMIAPDMATMLAFVATDADLSADVLQQLLTRANNRSFNSITVDGDTSTSDTLLLAATGKAGNTPIRSITDPRLRRFSRALEELLIDLAQQVVKDGEGASKFITVEVTGATSARSARRMGLAIANSPLVKTAIAGEDANWGRIVMAVGKSGERADRDRLAISIGGVEIAQDGQRVEDYDETPIAEHMKGQDILIQVDAGVGRGRARVWTCDLTHGYIDINADYRS